MFPFHGVDIEAQSFLWVPFRTVEGILCVDLMFASHSAQWTLLQASVPRAGVPQVGFLLSTWFTFAWFMAVFAVCHLPSLVIQWQTEGKSRLALGDL